MLQNNTLKTVLKSLLSVLLSGWLLYSLYHQLKHQPHLPGAIHQLWYSLRSKTIYLFPPLFLLWMLNLGLETQKWRILLRRTERMNFNTALLSVFSGIAISMITPNRIGEYLGRILYLRNAKKGEGITVTVIGSFAQLIVSAFFGFTGTIFYIGWVRYTSWLLLLAGISLILLGVLSYLYFHLKKVLDWIRPYAFLRKLIPYLRILRRIPRRELHQILLYSAGRYMVYSLQFYLLLHLCMAETNLLPGMGSIFLIFWSLVLLPSIAIAEIGIRGQTALYFLMPVCGNELGILSATVLLWLMNLVVPALLGCVFLYRGRWFDSEQAQKG